MRLASPVESNGFVTGALHVLLGGEPGAMCENAHSIVCGFCCGTSERAWP